MRALPPLGLLLDVDGPIASPVTRRVPEGILTALVQLAGRGIPVVFNTGRSADFVLQQLAAPLLAAGLPADARFHAVCEKGAVRFSFASLASDSANGQGHDAGPPPATLGTSVPGWVEVDAGMRLPADLESQLARLLEDYADTMFFDDTKLAMFSAEMTVGLELRRYRQAQSRFEAEVAAMLAATGAGVEAGGAFQLDSTIISSDVEHASSGKDLGAARGWDRVAADGELPVQWFTCGDSRTDYAMADWLSARGDRVTHVDVRHEDGIPEVPYPVLTGEDLAVRGYGRPEARHEEAGQALLEWVLNTMATPPAMM